MKHLLIAGYLAAMGFGAPAQAQSQDRPPLGVLPAYSRDYTFLADPARRTDALDTLKYIPLGSSPDVYLSLSGEARLRYDDFTHNPGFGINAPLSDDYVFTRAALGADLHLGPRLHLFGQLVSTRVNGKIGALSQTDASGYDWQQGFAEVSLPQTGETHLGLRLGRQEVILGSQRLVALRDGPNIRQAFDGVRFLMKRDRFDLTAFAFHPVRPGVRSFDDRSDRSQDFYGVYATIPLAGVTGAWLDLYVLQLNRRAARFAQGTADERRSSVGGRLWGNRAAIDYNFEALYQFGDFGSKTIRAWTWSSDTGYTPSGLALAPRFGLKADIASGDKNPNDGVLGTFNPLFPKGGYFTETGLVGPANIADLQPNLTLNPSRSVSLVLGIDLLWRQTTADAVYRQPNVPIPGTSGAAKRFTGTQAFVSPTWQIDSHTLLSATFVHASAGQAIRVAGGKPSDYASAWLTYRF